MGELLTADSVSPGVGLAEVAISLGAFTLIYLVLAVVEAKLLFRYVKAGPAAVMPYPSPDAGPEKVEQTEDERVPAFVY
jgi:cytochrome d ubiquinol oxidase subunit I